MACKVFNASNVATLSKFQSGWGKQNSSSFLRVPQLHQGIRKGKNQISCKIAYLPPDTANLDSFQFISEGMSAIEDCVETFEEEFGVTSEQLDSMIAAGTYKFEIGQVVEGTVAIIQDNGALVEIGGKKAAFLPASEASIYNVDSMQEANLDLNFKSFFEIVGKRSSYILSLRKHQYRLAWERLRKLREEDATLIGIIESINKGGLLVLVEGIRGFLPLSLLGLQTPKEDLIGTPVAVKIMEVDESRERLVLNNRKVSTSSGRSFTVGTVVQGNVASVKPYGAFIDIGGSTGLLHISQISHDRVTNVEAVLSQGDVIKVLILSSDKEKGRLSLSTKKLEPTPGDMLRNPAIVFEKAEEMASIFRERVAAAEAAARAEELRLQQEGYDPLSVWQSDNTQ